MTQPGVVVVVPAQQSVERTMRQPRQDVTVMNADAVILGTGDPRRVGSVESLGLV